MGFRLSVGSSSSSSSSFFVHLFCSSPCSSLFWLLWEVDKLRALVFPPLNHPTRRRRAATRKTRQRITRTRPNLLCVVWGMGASPCPCSDFRTTTGMAQISRGMARGVGGLGYGHARKGEVLSNWRAGAGRISKASTARAERVCFFLQSWWKEGWVDAQPQSSAEKPPPPPRLLIVVPVRLSSGFVRGVGWGRGHSAFRLLLAKLAEGGLGWPPPHSNAEKARRHPRFPLCSSYLAAPLLVLLVSLCLPSLFLGRVRGGGGGNM